MDSNRQIIWQSNSNCRTICTMATRPIIVCLPYELRTVSNSNFCVIIQKFLFKSNPQKRNQREKEAKRESPLRRGRGSASTGSWPQALPPAEAGRLTTDFPPPQGRGEAWWTTLEKPMDSPLPSAPFSTPARRKQVLPIVFSLSSWRERKEIFFFALSEAL